MTNSNHKSTNFLLWGIDLGGTKIEIAVIDSNKDEVVLRERIDTEQENGYTHILNQIKKLITLAEKKLNCTANKVGIGTPGSLDPQTGLMRNSNTTCLNGKKVEEDLTTLIGKKLFFANDANCLALAEVKFGVVRDYPMVKTAFGVIMGTGIGGGLVVNGKIVNGHMGIAGEWGHNFLGEEGGMCYCGRVGCVERFVSGPGLERYYEKKSGKKLKFKDIYKNYKAGNDTYAQETLQYLFKNFGKAIAVVINIFDPDIIVLGGGIGNVEELYTLGRNECKKYIFNTSFSTIIVPPKNGDSAGVFGAAFLSAD